MGLDVGPDSIETFYNALDTAKTVIWNGPMGVFEFEKFAGGTEVRYILWLGAKRSIMSFAFEFPPPPLKF
jgi:phosphoglycerate kinase